MTYKHMTIIATFLMLMLLFACTPTRRQAKPEVDLAPIQRQMTETNDKVNQLYHRVSMIQLMADNHQKTIQELENKLKDSEAKTEAVSIALKNVHRAKSQLEKKTEIKSSIYSPKPIVAETKKNQVIAAATPLYNKALNTFRKDDFKTAEKLFDTFLKQHPNDPLADNALYWSGECHYAQKNFADAVIKFKEVINRFPQGSKVPDALLKIGYSYFSMGDKEQAKNFLKKAVTSYPFSTAGTKAEEKLKELQR